MGGLTLAKVGYDQYISSSCRILVILFVVVTIFIVIGQRSERVAHDAWKESTCESSSRLAATPCCGEASR